MLRTLMIGALLFVAHCANASQVANEWYFGSWKCQIDGRPARMIWRVVDDPNTSCVGDICTTTSGVKVVGKFSDNNSRWVPLKVRSSSSSTLNIRYMGAEQDNWFLRYDRNTRRATGWTTWRGNRYALSCGEHRR